MEPIFMIHVVTDEPVVLNNWHGFGSRRRTNTDIIPVVTGHEEIELCYTIVDPDAITVAVDGFICDSQNRPIGVYLQACYEDQKKDYGRYELLLNHTLTIRLPRIEQTIFGEDEETSVYNLTLCDWQPEKIQPGCADMD